MFFKSAVVASLASSAFATIFITSPVATTTFNGGQKASITWQDDGKAPSLADWGLAKVSIYTGNAKQQTSLQEITNSVNVSAINSIEFTPNAAIGPNSKEYFVRIESLTLKDAASPQYPALAFSAKFQMNGMSGTFSPDIQAQIDGQSTAPLAGSSSTASSPSASMTTSKVSSASTTATRAAAASASASGESNGASAVSMGNSKALLAVLGGIAAGAMLL
ncbi:hypothetical protein VNI00_005257 [Paramarasmius palmivorus]|uniref:Yeast cell wall synthesis Kre9/Knh1-like N-terminal domain-containing protein n=1 Tax=Paramarasmius palmivorus TaxID=297713 RepID=A0AAW0DFN0_9AGAR